MYSQNELNNGYITTIQLVIILGNLFYRKTFTHSKRSIVVLAAIVFFISSTFFEDI